MPQPVDAPVAVLDVAGAPRTDAADLGEGTMATTTFDQRGDDGDPDATLHPIPIGQAARLTGVSPGLLRLWERERLITPRRTTGGHRLYSTSDLHRLRQIARLRRLDRLNAAAIRRELGPPARPPGPAAPTAEPGLGSRLRATRNARGWSLAAVAERCDLSVSFLSAVERGQATPSVGTLFKLADAYGTTVPALGSNRPGTDRPLLRPPDRPRFIAGGGSVLIEDLIARPGALEAQRIEIQAGGGSEDAYAHPGEEFVYVLAGEVTFWILGDGDPERQRLEPGDALHFQSTRPHRWRNDGPTTASLLWINVPVVDPPPTAEHLRAAAHPRPPAPNHAPRPAPPPTPPSQTQEP